VPHEGNSYIPNIRIDGNIRLAYKPCHPGPSKGRIAIVTTRGWDAVAATASARTGSQGGNPLMVLRERRLGAVRHGADGVSMRSRRRAHASCRGAGADVRGRRSRVVLAPEAGAKPCGASRADRRERKDPPGDGGNRARLPGESAKDTVKTIRAGKAGMPASPVTHPCALSSHTGCGCRRRPAFPAPFPPGRGVPRLTRAYCAAGIRTHVRDLKCRRVGASPAWFRPDRV